MIEHHFQQQIGRLIECYGKNSYPGQRVKVLWQAVKDCSDQWMTKTVDRLIGSERQAPLLGEFQEAMALERERQDFRERQELKQDAKDFWQGSYHPEEEKPLFETIRKRLRGQVSDQDYGKFIELLKSASQEQTGRYRCRRCEDSGCYFDERFKGFTLCSCRSRGNA